MDAESAPIDHDQTAQARTRKSFPIVQLSIIWLIQFTEPVSNTVIYPFINQFVAETGITRGDETRTGYYAGIIESSFFFAECLSVYHWGRLSDRIGRRPVLLLGPLGLACAMLTFGLSSNFWMLVVSRCAQGVFNGNIGVGKSVMIEITDPADVPTAFGWIPAIWSIGITLGPVIGGALAQPAIRWPNFLGRCAFFHNFPYFLPCAVAGAIAMGSFLYTYFLLQESLPSAVKRDFQRKQGFSESSLRTDSAAPLLSFDERSACYGTSESMPGPENHADLEPPPFRALLTREVIVALMSTGSIAFIDQSFGVMVPLMLSTSIPLGGLGFDPYTIGMTMGTWGLLNAGFQVVMFPRMFRWFGPHKLCIMCFSCAVATFSGFPLTSFFAKQAGFADFRVWAVLGLQLLSFSFVFMAYSCTQLFVMDAAPGRRSIGAVNGLSQMSGSILRTLAPTFASSLFSLSIQRQLLGGYLVYAILAGISVSAAGIAHFLPNSLRGQTPL